MVALWLAFLVFVVSLVGLFHAYVFYPLSLAVVPTRAEQQSHADGGEDVLPTVTVAIAAYNEQGVLEAKLENTLALDYPRDRLQIVVVSDGSTDGTDAIVRSYADDVDLFRVEGRVGKTACQNRLVGAVDSEIVVFSDANSFYEPNAIRALVEAFEPGVGCVVGDLRHVETNRVSGEHLYWRYEQFVKRLESRVSTVVTGTGAIYAVRRTSYVPLPAETISDFAEPLALIDRGERVSYTSAAVAWERMSGSVSAELRRRIRIATRVWRTGLRWKHLFNPVSRPIIAYQLLSHRGLLGVTPLLVFGLMTSTAVLAVAQGGLFYDGVLWLLLSLCSLAVIGELARRLDMWTPTIVSISHYLLFAILGVVIGLAKYLHGGTVVTWETLDRSRE